MTYRTQSNRYGFYRTRKTQSKREEEEEEEEKDERITLDDTFYVFVFIASASYVVRYEKVFSYIKEEVHI